MRTHWQKEIMVVRRVASAPANLASMHHMRVRKQNSAVTMCMQNEKECRDFDFDPMGLANMQKGDRMKRRRIMMDFYKGVKESVVSEISNAVFTQSFMGLDSYLWQELTAHMSSVLTDGKMARKALRELAIRVLLRCIFACFLHSGASQVALMVADTHLPF